MKSIFNPSGFSLVSVLIATALAGGLALVVMQLSDNMSSIESRSMATLDAKELLTEFRLILDDERHCRLSLAGENPAASPVKFKKNEIDETDSEDGLPVEIWIGNIDGTSRAKKKFSESDDLYKKYGKIKIESIRLYMNNSPGSSYPPGPGSDLGTLRLKYSFFQNKVEKGYLKDFLVRVSFTTSGAESTIQSCSRTDSGSSTVALKRANCSTSANVNNYDQPVNFTCPGSKAISGESSIHHSGYEDRMFSYICCDVLDQSNTVLPRRSCYTSGEVNDLKDIVNFTCPQGFFIVGTNSEHFNSPNEDRRFSYTCCDYGEADAITRWSNVTYSGWVNDWDDPVNFTCGADEFICGMVSRYSHNSANDRLFAFRCCKGEVHK